MLLHDLVDDRQPKPSALPHLLGREERIKDLRQYAFGDTNAVVDHLYGDVVRSLHLGDYGDDTAVVRRGLRRIGDQVEEYLIELGGATTDGQGLTKELCQFLGLGDDALGHLQSAF